VNPRRKTHLLEDGVAYFHPGDEFYADGPIKPVVAAMAAQQDWFDLISDAGRECRALRLRMECLPAQYPPGTGASGGQVVWQRVDLHVSS
jgi:hypothetical protein